jgi:DNA-binding transcriptional regulator YdaS (Cro superfamily)
MPKIKREPRDQSTGPARALRRAVDILGTKKRVAQVVGCAQPSACYIFKNEVPVPDFWCARIEIATQGAVTARQLRPDLPFAPVFKKRRRPPRNIGGVIKRRPSKASPANIAAV